MEHRVSSLAEGHRLLAAIMVTDAVGFSTRMSVDEALTLRLIDQDLKLIAQMAKDFGGTVLKSTGDGLLIYFLSAVEAVSCGLEMQRQLMDQALKLLTTQSLSHRIGIHLGDIIVSEQDVMGNGVNITARLQTYAKPHGLCVSQTIYDVVKARLSLQATFLGPLHLKNIQEPVPAYQISLHSELDTSAAAMGQPTQTSPIGTDALLGNALRALITHPQSKRIRKLVFATYQQAWENDSAVLAQFDLQGLVLALRERYPTLGELEQQLQRVVQGLNRQTVYTEIATILVAELQPWYLRSLCPSPEALQNEITILTVRSVAERGRLVAQNLRQHPDFLRLRKLLYCLCHQRWENDAAILDQVDLPMLVQQVLQVAPQSQDLHYHLSRIVKRLNRRHEYTRLANCLIEQLQLLYLEHASDNPLAAPASSDSQDSAPNHTVVTPLQPDRPGQGNGDVTSLQSALASGSGITGTEAQPLQRDRASLFDLRVEIMQFTNPLRAKILLHSCLHGPFGYTPPDWTKLSHSTLDELLRNLFDYCPSYADLDSKLTIMAHCLGQPREALPVASRISQAMRAYYPQNSEVALAKPSQPERLSPRVGVESGQLQSNLPKARAPIPPGTVSSALFLA